MVFWRCRQRTVQVSGDIATIPEVMSKSPRVRDQASLCAAGPSSPTTMQPAHHRRCFSLLLRTLGVGSLAVFPAVSTNAQGLRSNVATITLLVTKPHPSGAERPFVTRDASAALPSNWATADEVRVEVDGIATPATGDAEFPRFFVRDAFRRFTPLQADSGVLVRGGPGLTTIVSFRALVPSTLTGTAISVRYQARWGGDSVRVEQLHAVVTFPAPVSRAP